jgi:hypothetical protein
VKFPNSKFNGNPFSGQTNVAALTDVGTSETKENVGSAAM